MSDSEADILRAAMRLDAESAAFLQARENAAALDKALKPGMGHHMEDEYDNDDEEI